MIACLRTLVLAQFRDSEADPIPVSRDGRLTQAWSKRFPRTKRQLLDAVRTKEILLWDLYWVSWESSLSLSCSWYSEDRSLEMPGRPCGAACRRMDPQPKEADPGVEKSCMLMNYLSTWIQLSCSS